MKTPLRTLLVTALLVASSACAVRVDPFEPAALGTQVVVQREWKSGVPATFARGAVVARFVEGRARRDQSGWATAPRAFTVSSGSLALRGDAGERYQVRGRTVVNGREYLAVDLFGPGGLSYSLLLDGRGRITDRVLRGLELLTDRFTVAPTDALLELEVVEEFDERAPFRHRELRFGGVEGGKLVLELYEFGPGGTSAPLSLSRQEFPAEPATIEIGGWTLRVDAVSPTRLEAAVVADTFVKG